ncbi:hypothetical protein [Candidatus Phytoplasma rubi]|nr:hypothetical protein [Candidatus Phytoplasma rubi]
MRLSYVSILDGADPNKPLHNTKKQVTFKDFYGMKTEKEES